MKPNTICIKCGIDIYRKPCRIKARNYCSNSCQMKYEYEHGIRDKKTITKKANEKVKELVQKGDFVLQDATRRGEHWINTLKKEDPEQYKTVCRKHKLRMLNTLANYPKRTSIEKKMANILFKLNIPYKEQVQEFEYLLDFKIEHPTKKINIETDGEYWHSRPQEIKKNQIRDRRLSSVGYEIIRVKEHEFNNMEHLIEKIRCTIWPYFT